VKLAARSLTNVKLAARSPGHEGLTARVARAKVWVMLEVIEKGSCSAAHPVPLLFVHGGWHSAFAWNKFLDFFADAGYRAVAMSLRGHGGSPTAKRFHACSMADYIDDVRVMADELGGHPVFIAHSLGGFVVQRYLENHDAPAAVLVASVRRCPSATSPASSVARPLSASTSSPRTHRTTPSKAARRAYRPKPFGPP
jgi:pimeloyl-ACP methyl ester carboxylesterase